MGIVILPRVSPETTVKHALTLLRTHKRGGVIVVKSDEEYRLLYASDLFRAKEQGIETVGRIRRNRPVLIVDNRQALNRKLDLVRPWKTEKSFDKFFINNKANFALALEFGGDDLVAVVTRHETQEAVLSTTGGYRCSGTPTHRFPDPLVDLREECPRFPECSLPSGRVPTIRPN